MKGANTMLRRSNYTAKFKTKIVPEVLKKEKELGVIAAENNYCTI